MEVAVNLALLIGVHSNGRTAPKRARQSAAVLGATGLHLLLLLALWVGSRGGGALSGGGTSTRGSNMAPGASAMMVSLVSVDAINSVRRQLPGFSAEAADPLLKLLRRSLADTPSVLHTSADPARSASLDRLIAEADRSQTQIETAHISMSKATGGSKNLTESKTTGSKLRAVSGSETEGLQDLSAAVEPCWRRALDRSRLPVVLEITLNARGLSAGPPKVVRLGDGDRESQRIAVERALQAVAACLPFSSGQPPPEGRYSVSFGLSKP